jgi:hypothetical protein
MGDFFDAVNTAYAAAAQSDLKSIDDLLEFELRQRCAVIPWDEAATRRIFETVRALAVNELSPTITPDGVIRCEWRPLRGWLKANEARILERITQELRRPERPKDQEWLSVEAGLDRFMDKSPQLLDQEVARSRLQKAYVRGKIVSAGKGRDRVLQVESLDAWIQGQIAKTQDGRDATTKAERKPKF